LYAPQFTRTRPLCPGKLTFGFDSISAKSDTNSDEKCSDEPRTSHVLQKPIGSRAFHVLRADTVAPDRHCAGG
jgi:hypothetical protein